MLSKRSLVMMLTMFCVVLVLFLSTALAWLLHQLMDFKAPHYRWCRRKRGEG